MANQPANPTNAAIVANALTDLMATDPELKSRIRTLASSALDWAEFNLRNGDPAARNNVIRFLLPVMVKEAAASDDEARFTELSNMVEGLREEMRRSFGASRALDVPEVQATEDAPR
jgi:hypothetical protein